MWIFRPHPALVVLVAAATAMVATTEKGIALGLTPSPAAKPIGRTLGASQPACTLADEELFAPRAIDNSACGLAPGMTRIKRRTGSRNNFCAGGFLTNDQTDDPAHVTQFSFRQLQEKTKSIRTELKIDGLCLAGDSTESSVAARAR